VNIRRQFTAPPRLEATEEKSGDPYFNECVQLLMRHRTYPSLARPLGLRGTAHFEILIDRRGVLVAVHLFESSGSDLLDRTAEQMIRDTAPFPPPPPSYLRGSNTLAMTAQIPMAPD
jgi:protein TonB